MVTGGAYYGSRPTEATLKPFPSPPTDPPTSGLAVLVLCSGRLRVWEGDEPKQLRKVGKETVLARITRQVRDNGYAPIIITWRKDIMAATSHLPHHQAEHCRTIAETWLYTRELWREQTVILLGDVIHGNETMKNLLNYRGTMKMVGNSAEIYAFTFPSSEHDKTANTLYDTNRDTTKGSPWEIYRRWCGTEYNNRGFRENKVFQWVWDRTCDIDTPNEYAGALRVDWETGIEG